MSEPTTIELLQAIHDLGQRMENRFAAIETEQRRQTGSIATIETEQHRQAESIATIEKIIAMIQIEQRRQAEAFAEMRGELRGLSTWLASMDQRFVALMMHSYEPRKPTA
ncbi:MAG: hypothetical protein FD149_2365 [Rhodospirillaceae bacterium]|nr:MAG: hypothetical protein FD149_2365 [Rhodospirillaceae bacterium]